MLDALRPAVKRDVLVRTWHVLLLVLLIGAGTGAYLGWHLVWSPGRRSVLHTGKVPYEEGDCAVKSFDLVWQTGNTNAEGDTLGVALRTGMRPWQAVLHAFEARKNSTRFRSEREAIEYSRSGEPGTVGLYVGQNWTQNGVAQLPALYGYMLWGKHDKVEFHNVSNTAVWYTIDGQLRNITAPHGELLSEQLPALLSPTLLPIVCNQRDLFSLTAFFSFAFSWIAVSFLFMRSFVVGRSSSGWVGGKPAYGAIDR